MQEHAGHTPENRLLTIWSRDCVPSDLRAVIVEWGQQTVCTKAEVGLAGALYAVVRRLSRLPVDEPVDKASLAVLHETRRLGTFRPSDLAAQMRLDLSTISRHVRSLEQQGMVQRPADPDDARAQRISITACGVNLLNRVLDDRAA